MSKGGKSRGQGQQCAYCRRRMMRRGVRSDLAATKDHVVPKRANIPTYAVWCCRQCNGIKGGMMPDVWSAFMKANPEWWNSK